MNKHTIIVIVSSVVITACIGYSALDVIAVDQLSLGWNSNSSFDYLLMLNGGNIEVCNPFFSKASFRGIAITIMYEGEPVGSFEVGGAVVPPGTVVELAGAGRTTLMAQQIISSYIEKSSLKNSRVDTLPQADSFYSDIDVTITADTTFLGVIPYSVYKEYSGDEFYLMMVGGTMSGSNDNNNCLS